MVSKQWGLSPENQSKKPIIRLAILIAIVGLVFLAYLFRPQTKLIIPNKIQEVLSEVENNFNFNQVYEKLIECESSKNKLAINLKDSDGTASFGLLQWKPETFRRLALKYGIIGEKANWNWIMTIIWDERINKKLFFEVINDKTENPYQLWPYCYKRAIK